MLSLEKFHEAKDHHMLLCRLVDEMKNFKTRQDFEKSCLIAQAYNDLEHGPLNYASTRHCFSKRLTISTVASDCLLNLFSRDMTQT